MKVKCEYCGKLVDESLASCPNCGASMPTANRVASDQPKTIDELKQWYTDHKLPPEKVTRFFIGKDIKEPKAFGIYKDGSGDFVVYKNKSSGERVIRYQGTDEGYAVNELYQRLKSEIADQKANRAKKSSGSKKGSGKKSSDKMTWKDWLLLPLILPFINPVFASIFFLAIFLLISLFDNSPSKGYYNYNGNDYYYQGSSWYAYDPTTDAWDYASNSDELDSVINDETDNDYMTDTHYGASFEDSNWYDSGSSDDSYDWDSDSSWSSSSDSDSWSSWDSGGWDSGGSDWDSDW